MAFSAQVRSRAGLPEARSIAGLLKRGCLFGKLTILCPSKYPTEFASSGSMLGFVFLREIVEIMV